MLPSAGEIVKRPHTSLTHNFQAQKNVRPQEASEQRFTPPWNAELGHSPVYLIFVRMTPAAIVSQRR